MAVVLDSPETQAVSHSSPKLCAALQRKLTAAGPRAEFRDERVGRDRLQRLYFDPLEGTPICSAPESSCWNPGSLRSGSHTGSI
jgi:hypothetical protein